MNKKIEKQIEEVKSKIQQRYKDIIIDHHYDLEEDLYSIYHNSSHLQYDDKEFLSYVGGLLRKHFLDKDIYNIGFCYDYDFDMEQR